MKMRILRNPGRVICEKAHVDDLKLWLEISNRSLNYILIFFGKYLFNFERNIFEELCKYDG